MTAAMASAEAGPSRPSTPLGIGATPYHDSSQLRHWRYSPTRLRQLRQALNEKAHEVTARNTELEKEAQLSLGHTSTDPPPPAAYLSVDEEVLLVQYYCSQAARIVREGFQLPESLETTAVTYLKRFYLKNSVMEWHPKVVMPTAVYLAAKTTNYPIPMDRFREKFAKLNPDEILEHEFLVAQSLAFEFWVHGPDKALRGWALDFQSQPDINLRSVQESLNPALQYLRASRLTDAEFIYTPSQIALACFRLANPELVDRFLDWRYDTADAEEVEVHGPPYGIERTRLGQILLDVGEMIKEGTVELDLKVIKGIDKRLKSCTNPEKVPGTALYIKRKQEQEAAVAAVKAEKTLKLKKEMSETDMLFGDVIQPSRTKKPRRIMSPRVVVGADRPMDVERSTTDVKVESGTPTAEETGMEGYEQPASGMGVRDEAMGLLTGGAGLKDVGRLHEDT